jgi:AraC family transcriptional regulator of arabinose operon
LYCTAGSGVVFLKGESFHLTPNQFIIIPKNTAHEYKTSVDDPWTIYWMHFTGDHADNFYKRYVEFNLETVFSAYEEYRIKTFDQILKLLENNFGERNLEVAHIKLQEFLSNFLYPEEINPSSSRSDKISDSISFMKKNIQHQFSVYELAQQQNLSATHYSRMFRAKTGNSPNHYFNELKIQKACQYLYFTNQSIKEICAELGFQDPYYFSRLFKKFMGISPINYKSKRNKN